MTRIRLMLQNIIRSCDSTGTHQATICAAVMDPMGKVIIESIPEFFAGLPGTLSVTFEEGTWAAWLYDLLKPRVANLVVCNPKPVRRANQK